jgi:hypothetical protein
MFLALDHGINSIQEGGPLIPFVVTEEGRKRMLQRFGAQPYEQAVAEARAAVARLSPQVTRYALAYDGYLTQQGTKADAVIVQGAERNAGMAYLLAQRYVPKAAGQQMETVGNAAYLGREALLFMEP